MKQEDIKRMNELYHLSQERALGEDEFAEWEELKKRYVADFKANLTAQLDNTYSRRKGQQAQARKEIRRQVIARIQK